jgi:hypothetical protein
MRMQKGRAWQKDENRLSTDENEEKMRMKKG